MLGASQLNHLCVEFPIKLLFVVAKLGQKSIITIGEIIFPEIFDFDVANQETIVRRLNEPDAFDTELPVSPRDILEVRITIKDNSEAIFVTYYFECSDAGRWGVKEMAPFELENGFESKTFGKIWRPSASPGR